MINLEFGCTGRAIDFLYAEYKPTAEPRKCQLKIPSPKPGNSAEHF